MSGRRSHTRFAVANPWNGAIRFLRDVVVDRPERDELLAVSHAPAIVGEEMSLDLMGGGQNVAVKVRVIESRPVIIDGAVRHRIRLGLVGALIQSAVSDPTTLEMVARVAEAG